MIKTFSALAVAAVMAACIIVSPGFSPRVEAASEPAALAKSDRLPIRPVGTACSQHSWPYYEANCLRDRAQPAGQTGVVRVVSTDRRF